MYKAGDLIIYNGEGVCRIESVGVIDLVGIAKDKLYYTIQPLYRTGKIFVPVDTTVFMRPIISRQQADALIRRIPDIDAKVYENRNLRMLNEHYQALLHSHNCEDMLQLIKSVYLKRKDCISAGKKPGLVDDRYMMRAEDILYGELAAALNIPKDSVLDYITNILEH